ncbi:hypothetical protein LSH36_251g03121 [Paralvinella palmiformis]|uniref:Uridylate-specific endoribonuclease n=1 Tax=Paralvinella palmiformis TaxID=53620 RepID=A0AAD9JM43_9ANNE|nr:hypothetical protein LSH36_251g03121 [Paralvinella palmiformis]
MSFIWLFLASYLLLVSGQTSDQEILDVTSDIWNAAEAAGTFFSDTECQYDVNAGPGSFFTYVDETRLQSHTYGPHVDLLDNYITVTGTEDPCDLSCEGERSDYLDLLTATDAMNLAREFLGARNSSLLDPVVWKNYLYNLWFSPYTRTGGTMDSSGFEHVFLGEIDDNSAKGYHGWVKAYKDEQTGAFEYLGNDDLCQPDTPKFSMNYVVDGTSYHKSTTSMMIKAPPEVELAFFTICKFTRSNRVCTVTVGGPIQDIQTYDNDCSSEPQYGCIGSAYFIC